ncbi:Protein SHQ1-like [Holothuria leucospilota]|uniref:Protein SHQ1 homolog n=1 Tax=Holothuria leucospilota TaxID=206669 RepID=A0A9Q1CL21_HOLLE|nr:Protein SHQ1-like [Holothuria leucospilota]
MLTPAFELSQDSTFLTIIIKARFARISETEVFVDGKNFKFYSKPYFLRLNLPGALIEDGRETAEYDAEKGNFTIKLPKESPGEEFDGLDMLTKLMAPSGQVTASEPTIENITSSPLDEAQGEEEDEEEINWEVEQTPCLQDEDNIIGPVKYGFAGRRSGVFSRLQEELSCIVDIPDPDQTQPDLRRKARWVAEWDKFNDEHYLADLYQDETIQQLIAFKPPWDKLTSGVAKASSSSDSIKFTDDEKEQMRKLPHKEYLLDKAMEKEAYMGLVDILYGYAYNARCSEGEESVESAWTICKLSSTLSWLDTFNSLEDVVVCCVRRSLCYPLHRHWGLAMTVLRDVKNILLLGRNQVLKAVLAVHSLLAQDDPHYILNELYITDYCVWIQGESQSKIKKLAEALDKVKISKKDVSLDLEELEEAARCVLEDEDEDSGEGDAIQMIGYPQLIQQSSHLQDHITKNQSASQSSKEEDSDASEDETDSDESDEDDRDASDENSDEDGESLTVHTFSSSSRVEGEQSKTTSIEAVALASDIENVEWPAEQRTYQEKTEKQAFPSVCNKQNSRDIPEMGNHDFKVNLSLCKDLEEGKSVDDCLDSLTHKSVSEENEILLTQRNSTDSYIPSQMSSIVNTSHLLPRQAPSKLVDETGDRKDNDLRSKNVPGTTGFSSEEQPVMIRVNGPSLEHDEKESTEVNHLSSRVASLMIETSRNQARQDLLVQELDSDDESGSEEGEDDGGSGEGEVEMQKTGAVR